LAPWPGFVPLEKRVKGEHLRFDGGKSGGPRAGQVIRRGGDLAQSKYFAAETLWNAAQALAEIYGGRSVALQDEYPVSRYLSWASLFRTGEGPQNIQRVLIAEDTLGFKDANRHNIKRRFSLKSDL
jgi:alkylation response protein AidB-like acyl-CoA dehydrogenase